MIIYVLYFEVFGIFGIESRKQESAHFGRYSPEIDMEFVKDDDHYYEALCLTSLRCRCDRYCHVFDDCCIDNLRKPPAKDDSIWDIKRHLFCFGENSWEFGKACYIIARCPSTWTDQTVKRKCHNPNAYDIEEIRPVYDGTLHYRNRYCQQCHGLESPTQSWNVFVDVRECYVLKHLDNITTNEDLLNKLFSDPDCYFSFVPEEKWSCRKCYPRLVSDCKGTVDRSVFGFEFLEQYSNHLCQRLFAPMFYHGKYYRNIDCAICHKWNVVYNDSREIHECLKLHGKNYENNPFCPCNATIAPVYLAVPTFGTKVMDDTLCSYGFYFDGGKCISFIDQSKDVDLSTFRIICSTNVNVLRKTLDSQLTMLMAEGITLQSYVNSVQLKDFSSLFEIFYLHKKMGIESNSFNTTNVCEYVEGVLMHVMKDCKSYQ